MQGVLRLNRAAPTTARTEASGVVTTSPCGRSSFGGSLAPKRSDKHVSFGLRGVSRRLRLPASRSARRCLRTVHRSRERWEGSGAAAKNGAWNASPRSRGRGWPTSAQASRRSVGRAGRPGSPSKPGSPGRRNRANEPGVSSISSAPTDSRRLMLRPRKESVARHSSLA